MKVTILLPNYNNAPFLIECLDSIRKQTYTDFEILIVDDKSTDNSVEIIEDYPDSRIRLIKKDHNSGIIDTLNIGLENTNTAYAIRMDGDDLMHPERIEKLVNFMDDHPEIGACGSGIEHFGISTENFSYELDPLVNKANLIFQHTIGHASVIYRVQVLKENGIKYAQGYNYIEDYRIFYDLSKVTNMTSIPEMLYFYRREEYNNFKNLEEKKRGYLKLYEEILASLKFEDPKSSARIHYEIQHKVEPSFRKKEYLAHLNKIITQNNILENFPKNELQQVIKRKKDQLFYKLTDAKWLKFSEAISFFIDSPKKMYYFLKS